MEKNILFFPSISNLVLLLEWSAKFSYFDVMAAHLTGSDRTGLIVLGFNFDNFCDLILFFTNLLLKKDDNMTRQKSCKSQSLYMRFKFLIIGLENFFICKSN